MNKFLNGLHYLMAPRYSHIEWIGLVSFVLAIVNNYIPFFWTGLVFLIVLAFVHELGYKRLNAWKIEQDEQDELDSKARLANAFKKVKEKL